jgi:heat shock protein HslJ
MPGIQSAELVPATQDDLVGPLWQWEDWVETRPASQSLVPDPEKYTVSFAADGSVSIQADCNRVSGVYIVRNGILLIELGPATMAFCGEQSLDQEFLALLTRVVAASLVNGLLRLSLADHAGHLGFRPGNMVGIAPQDISLDTQGLPYSWQANVVAATPYDASQPPGPMGLPEHIQINFGVTNPADKRPGDPVMYIIPVDAYRELWAQAGNDAVARTIDEIFRLTVALQAPPPSMGLPALPFEEIGGVNDLAAQIGRASVTDLSATKNGFRFVGRWMQSPNPVVNGDLRYVYQGFTNDGRYLVSFFYPVTTTALPNSAGDVPAQEFEQLESDPIAYLQSKADALNALAPSAWMPDLTVLDALVGSLQIANMTANGLQGNVWRPLAMTSAPGGPETPITEPQKYSVTYYSDGTLAFMADCIGGIGTYTVSGGMLGGIRSYPGPATADACGSGSFADEFVATLASAQNYRLLPGGSRMELIRPAGGGSLFFEWVGPAASTPAPPIALPTPGPQVPTGRVIAPEGVNVRTGPGTQYPVIGLAPFGATGEIVGRSADGQWWAAAAPASPTGLGWVSAAYVEVTNAQNVPILPAPPLPTPPPPLPTSIPAPPTPTPVPPTPVPPTPTPVIQFSANPTSLVQGQCTILSWHVENVSAVWVYPLGADYTDYPVVGIDSRQECPETTTTYEMRVALYNGSIELRQVTVDVQAANPLAGTRWVLASMHGNQAPLPNTTITLSFDDADSISGDGGCNNYAGVYTVSGITLLIGGVSSTGALCGDEIDQQEHLYLTTLQSSASYDLNDSQLIIRGLSGQELLRFNRAG